MTDAALARLRAAYADPAAEVARAHAAGTPVVGYFLNSVPIELVLAAGMHPIRLTGRTERTPVRADRYMEEYFDGEVRAIFEALLAGEHAALDLLVVPRSAEIYLQLYYWIGEIPRWEPEVALPPAWLFDLLQTPSYTTTRYVIGRLHAMAERLHRAGGVVIDDARLAGGIALANRLRAAVTAASTLWHGEAPRLSGADALHVIAAAQILHPDEAIAVLEALVGNPPAPIQRSGPRLMVKGSPQHHTRFTMLVEDCGARVVAHDHIAGDRIFERPVRESGDPWEALALHYQREIPGPRAYPQAREDARFLALAEAAAVDGVVIIHDEWDDTLGWEYPDQKRAMDARGLPSLFLKRQSWFAPPEAAQRAAIGGFIDQIERGRA
ncbi:2-hydroxyacyl-CoA dehydratase subunit D [Sphingomonas baiyangensis]|uniref:2-hydroxyacyl-CoA dehydratase subunit D n=1 Tax=Sphingomonas baiyangensis TaxID=2572576 RepID=UPI00146E645B|nr:2-hydroxyacyl-CoA dehydratase family protein [Sphingomonas baiyangensis]